MGWCIISFCSGCDACCASYLIYDTCGLKNFRVVVLLFRCYVFVSCVHPVVVLNAAFCVV